MHTIFESKRIVVRERDGWEFVERVRGKSAVAIVALTEDGRLILTEQFRRPVNARVIDLPAGLVGDEEGVNDPEATAKKELEEETGYTCRSVELLAKGPSSPGITSEQVSLYRARDVRRVGEGGGVAGEDITVHMVRPEEIAEFAERQQRHGTLIDLKVWSGLHFLTSGE